jgi:hypothetical protein
MIQCLCEEYKKEGIEWGVFKGAKKELTYTKTDKKTLTVTFSYN